MPVTKTDTQIRVITRVKKQRVDRDISQQQLALILGATNGNVGNIESLKFSNKYTFSQLNTLAHHFGVPIDQFFRDDDEPPLSVSEFSNRVCDYLEGNS